MPNIEHKTSDVKRQTAEAKTIHVVAGIIYNASRDHILIAKRPDHLHQGGLWEFPGGKVDDGESSENALFRELLEELNIQVTQAESFHQLSHRYPEKTVHLDFWTVNAFSGKPNGNEGQQIAWVPLAELNQYPFPAANQPVLELICRS